MGKLLTKLSGGNRNNSNKNTNNNNNSNSNNNNSKNGAESKEEEKKQQTLAQKADSMQEVIPNIFMGSYAAAKDKELLEYHKITHILAIGWDLKAYFKEDFDYLILSNVEDNPSYTIIKHFDTAFQFMDSCLRPQNSENASNNLGTKLKNALNDANSVDKNTQYINNSKNGNENSAQGRLFVHCHKGLSRSASIIMGYVMSREKKTFEQVLNQIRERRSFIMPNIGFQAQLQVFEEKKCSLDMSEYDHLDVMARISDIIPGMYNSIVRYYGYYENNQEDKVDGQDLFGLTMYFHQLFMLDKERTLTGKDKEYLTNAIDKLYNIQKKFIQIDESTTRFEKLFKLGKYSKPKAKAKPKEKSKEKMVKPVKKKEEFEPPTHAKSERSMSGAEIAMDTAVLAAEHSAAEEDSEEDNLRVVGVDDNETNDNTVANASVNNNNEKEENGGDNERNEENNGNNGAAETFSKNPTVQDMALLANNANNENETNENNENEKGNDGNNNENGNENNEDYAD